MSEPEILPPAQPTIPSTPARVPNNAFRGPNGIRAGWRAGMFILLVGAIAALGAILLGLISRLVPGHHGAAVGTSTITPLGLGISEAVIFVVAALAALIMSRIEHRKFGQYGLPSRSAFGKDFWVGAVVGFASISGCLVAIWTFHGFRITGLAIHGGTIVSGTAVWGATFVIVGLAEEFAFRGYLQYTLTTGMGFWPSAILLSLLFGLAHATNPGESKSGLVSVVLFGLLFCFFLWRRGNLWWAVGFHAGWDWGQTFFYGVPDSGIPAYHNLFNSSFRGPAWVTGGSVGPEASIFTPLVLAIVAMLFARAYRERRYTTS